MSAAPSVQSTTVNAPASRKLRRAVREMEEGMQKENLAAAGDTGRRIAVEQRETQNTIAPQRLCTHIAESLLLRRERSCLSLIDVGSDDRKTVHDAHFPSETIVARDGIRETEIVTLLRRKTRLVDLVIGERATMP